MTWLALLAGGVVGLTLGLVGGGGSLLAVPLLGLLGLEPGAAKAGALLVVAAAAVTGLAQHLRAGAVDARAALLVGGAGAPVSYLVAAASRGLPGEVQTALFAVVAAVAGGLLLRRPAAPPASDERPAPPAGAARALAAGAAAGALTGLVGVGGGFVVVPILALVVGLPPRRAVGTSLAVVAASALAGLVGASGGLPAPTPTLVWFMLGAGAASVAGARLAGRVPQARLRTLLGLVLVGVALLLLGQVLGPRVAATLRAPDPA